MKDNLCGGLSNIQHIENMKCCDFNNGRVESVEMRKLHKGSFQIRENEYGEWQDCEIEFDEFGNMQSLSFIIKAMPLL